VMPFDSSAAVEGREGWVWDATAAMGGMGKGSRRFKTNQPNNAPAAR
jgi:hypothetical protein